MSARENNHLFDLLLNNLGSECEICLVRGDPVYGRLISFNKYPLTLQIGGERLINFAHVVEIRFAKKRNVQSK